MWKKKAGNNMRLKIDSGLKSNKFCGFIRTKMELPDR